MQVNRVVHSKGWSVPGWIGRAAPWLLFGGLLLWGWRTSDLFRTVPSYGDALEGLWATEWYANALRTGVDPSVFPLAFFPVGWHVATYAWGPVNFLILLPLNALGGAAFAYNLATLITFALAFAGTLALARRFVSGPPAAVVAALYTFWGFRWYNIIGQLNIGLGSALLPWMVWSLERGLDARERSWRWFALAGALWAVSISASAYFLWIGGVLLLGWLAGRWRQIPKNRHALASLAALPLVAGVLSLPALLMLWAASKATGAGYFSIYDLNLLGANANGLALPDTEHPWLGALVKSVYHGDEGEVFVGFGLLACLMAVLGLFSARRMRARWLPVLIAGGLGLLLCLGLTLTWNGGAVKWPLIRAVDQAVWQVGYRLKPGLFLASQPPAPFDNAVPLPALLLTAVVPFFERARVLSRYALLAGLAIFLFAGLGLERIRVSWLRWAVAALLIVEVLPAPTLSFAYPPPSHPAFEWLRQQQPGSITAIAEFAGDDLGTLELSMGGSAIWATGLHGKPTIAGASSIMPAHVAFLQGWLLAHAHPFQDPEFPVLLGEYGVSHVLLHLPAGVAPGAAQSSLNEALSSDAFRFVRCFEPSSLAQPYDHTICIFELLPPATQQFNVLFREGWSGAEDWGRWLDGTSGRALWVAPEPAPYRLNIQVFPYCLPGRYQRVDVEVNAVPLGSHEWTDCEPWVAQIPVPAEVVRGGENVVTLKTAYAARPVDVTDGENKDDRKLSLGLARLYVEPAH